MDILAARSKTSTENAILDLCQTNQNVIDSFYII